MKNYDVIIIGSGPAGLGAAFQLSENSNKSILLLDKLKISSGGLRNDCKQNYLYPIGFPIEYWEEQEATECLKIVEKYLKPEFKSKYNIETYKKRALKLNTELIEIKQYHVGTDKSVLLIQSLIDQLIKNNVTIELNKNVISINENLKQIILENEIITYDKLILAPGRSGADWLRNIMKDLNIEYTDNIVDIGIRIETKEQNYPIIRDYYDPKFMFPKKVRTFCTNSRAAYVVKEKYKNYFSVNGHAYSNDHEPNNLVNFAMLKTIVLTDPVVSGHDFAEILGKAAMSLSGGKPMMQRVGDFRLGKRSKKETFNNDLYDFKPTLESATPGDISLAMPGKILRDIWKSMKILDAIIPGILHPSTIMYYPEIKTYANKPVFIDNYFKVKENIYMIGDGAGTSRGITAAWASGIRSANGILK
jgi:uncharacterized protein